MADIAMGALSKGLTPISIFSNLLNAYATLDNKHDITGELMNRKVALAYTTSIVLLMGLIIKLACRTRQNFKSTG